MARFATIFDVSTNASGIAAVEIEQAHDLVALPNPPVRISIATGMDGPYLNWLIKDLEIHQRTYFVGEPDAPVDLKSALVTLQHLQHFLDTGGDPADPCSSAAGKAIKGRARWTGRR